MNNLYYVVQNFNSHSGKNLQEKIKSWIKDYDKDIVIKDINIWYDSVDRINYATIIFYNKQYE